MRARFARCGYLAHLVVFGSNLSDDSLTWLQNSAPADVGKRDLQAVLRARFTELWVGEPTARGELAALAAAYLADALPNPPVDSIVDFYLAAKAEAVSNGVGGSCSMSQKAFFICLHRNGFSGNEVLHCACATAARGPWHLHCQLLRFAGVHV